MFCELEALRNESDVEQKLLMPLLAEQIALGYSPEEIRTKTFLAPVDIDKGAGRKKGYYPDYVIVLSNLPVLVIEAKSPNEDVDVGFKEAALYALEVNKAFNPGLNPCSMVVACNGKELLFGAWDSGSPSRLTFAELCSSGAEWEQFRTACGRRTMLDWAYKIRRLIFPGGRHKPLHMIGGGPAVRNAQLPPNRFAQQLVPVLNRFVTSELTRTSQEILERGYCPTRDATHYDEILEALLTDNISRRIRPGVEPIETLKRAAPAFDGALARLVESSPSESQLILVIGAKGTGKSFFLDRYYYHLMSPALRSTTMWALIDFNAAPADLGSLRQWIARAFIEDFPKRNGLGDFLAFDMLKRYFAPDLKVKREGPYSSLVNEQPLEYNRLIAHDLSQWMDDSDKLMRSAIRYFAGDAGKRIVVVFDNADRRDRDQQLAIFQEVQAFRAETRTFCLLALRDETYDRYYREPPLDTQLKTFVFRVTPPRFLDVVKKRLELMIEELARLAPRQLDFQIPNGMVVRYPATDLGRYLIGIYKSLFNPARRLRLILEALAGRDVRRALEMFTAILMSPYLTDDRIFMSGFSAVDVRLKEWLVMRALMRTTFEYFTDEHGYVLNIFDVDELSATTTNFVTVEVLSLLNRDRKSKGELGIEGYRHVRAVIDELSDRGFTREDLLWSLDRLVGAGLVSSESQSTRRLSDDDHVKISASGYYHLMAFPEMGEYVSNVAVATWIRDVELARRIANISDRRVDPDERNRQALINRVVFLGNSFELEAERQAKQSAPPGGTSEPVRRIIASVRRAADRLQGVRGTLFELSPESDDLP